MAELRPATRALTSAGSGAEPAQDTGRRHRPGPGRRTRDSLFWQTVLPEHEVAVQVYLFVSDDHALGARAGYHVAVWGRGREPVLERGGGAVPAGADFDDLTVDGVRVRLLAPRQESSVTLRSPSIELDLDFRATAAPFSYHANPDGLPPWFALDRLEQSGRVTGQLRVDDLAVIMDGPGHRDHSWGRRDWRAPQHWKWFVAYTPSGRALNGWLWIARGSWGFAGYVLRAGRPVPVATIQERTTYDDAMDQRRLAATLVDVEGVRTRLELEVFGVLRLPDERTGTEIREGAGRVTIDGEPGAGQLETMWPAAYLRHLVGS